MQVPDVFTTLKTLWPHITWPAAIMFVATASFTLVKLSAHISSKASAAIIDWKQMKTTVTECNDQLKTAMQNHLPHIQDATERTAIAVEKVAQALQAQAIEQAKMLAVLETQNRNH